MSAWAPVRVMCDWPDCYARSQTRYTKVTEARKYTARHGWLHVAGMDFCGRPVQAEDAKSWHGCATKTEHLPQSRPAPGGGVYLSCACGWVVQPRYGWESVGVVPRASANLRWSEHVREIEKKIQSGEDRA